MEIIRLVTVSMYEIMCTDLMCVCVFVLCVFLLVIWEGKWGLVICSLTNGTEYESQNTTVIHGKEKVSQWCTLVIRSKRLDLC
jgi:hypothetical protein